MRTLLLSFFLMSSALYASEFQIIEGPEAYDLYLSLKGVRCVEWNSKDFIVYTKYQTDSCEAEANSFDWTCTIQVSKRNTSQKYESASCTREIK